MIQKLSVIFYALFVLINISCASSGAVYQNPPLATQSISPFTPQWENFVDGVEITRGRIVSPKLVFYALRVDLKNDNIQVITNGSNSAEGAASINGIKVINFARASDTVVAINAGPFGPVTLMEGGKKKIIGLFISDGIVVSPPASHYGAILFRRDKTAEIVEQSDIYIMRNIENALGGFSVILKGNVIPNDILTRKARHPRTAVALSNGGQTLIILIIDGRQFSSEGATEAETAQMLSILGAVDGLNLDGGGSTTLVLKKNGRYKVVNTPVNYFIAGAQRPVATCLGIIVSNSDKD